MKIKRKLRGVREDTGEVMKEQRMRNLRKAWRRMEDGRKKEKKEEKHKHRRPPNHPSSPPRRR